MANIEGVKRMARAGRFLLTAGVGSVLLWGVVTIAGMRIPLDAHVSWTALNVVRSVLLLLTGVAPIVLGVVLWFVGWVVEGFMIPRSQDAPR
jgi:hypothetical protein